MRGYIDMFPSKLNTVVCALYRPTIFRLMTLIITLSFSFMACTKSQTESSKASNLESASLKTQVPTNSGNANSDASKDSSTTLTAAQIEPDLTPDSNGLSKTIAVINTSKGIIKFRFYTNDAPNTIKRIITLAKEGFYNGLHFHRIAPGFVAQIGDPQSRSLENISNNPTMGSGGSGIKLKAEFSDRKHIRGTVAMARAGNDINSADSQFYLLMNPAPHLDNQYTIFGQIIDFGPKVDGKDVLDRLAVGDELKSFSFE